MHRRGSALIAAAMLLAACGGGSKKAAPTTTVSATTSGVPTNATTSTSIATTTTTTPPATTTSATPTTTSAPTTTLSSDSGTAAPTTLPDCRASTGRGACQLTVPLRPDSDSIVAAYRKFAEANLLISQAPDSADWDGYLATVDPESRTAARAELEQHFGKGEVLNTSLGVTLKPRSTQAVLPENLEIIEDCRADGSYWADRTTGEPVAGEVAAVKTSRYIVNMRRVNGTWYVAGFQKDSGSCSVGG